MTIDSISSGGLRCRLAQTPVIRSLDPVIAAHGREGVEQVMRVVLVFDSFQLVVVGAEEVFLPVRVEWDGLTEAKGIKNNSLH